VHPITGFLQRGEAAEVIMMIRTQKAPASESCSAK
jgi:hypothetical protein